MRNKLYYKFTTKWQQKQHSTETLNLLITDLLLDAMDNKKISALVLIDLSKAFDSISHSILLNKLSYIGASQDTVKWFRSYLTGRAQIVRIRSSLSTALSITHAWFAAGSYLVTTTFLYIYK